MTIKDNKINYLRMPSLTREEGSAENVVGGGIVQEEDANFFDPPLRTEVVYTSTYVNVDCSAPSGISRGVAHGLATSGIVDVVHSPDIYDAGRLFAPPTRAYGRALVILRHPIERVVAEYERLRMFDEDVNRMTLEEFARSDHLEDNILTRALSRQTDGQPLGNIHLAKAKEILKRKFVVGLFSRMEDSLVRFETFFGWNVGDQGRICRSNEVGRAMSHHYNRVDISAIIDNDGGSVAITALREKNAMDMALYEFATFLYDYQGHSLFGISAVVS